MHLPQLVQLFHNTGIPTIAKPHEMFIPSIQIAQAHEIKYQMYCNCIKKHPYTKMGKSKKKQKRETTNQVEVLTGHVAA